MSITEREQLMQKVEEARKAEQEAHEKMLKAITLNGIGWLQLLDIYMMRRAERLTIEAWLTALPQVNPTAM